MLLQHIRLLESSPSHLIGEGLSNAAQDGKRGITNPQNHDSRPVEQGVTEDGVGSSDGQKGVPQQVNIVGVEEVSGEFLPDLFHLEAIRKWINQPVGLIHTQCR